MKIGIGLPATIPGVQGYLIKEWAKKADEGPFSSLGVIDRLVYKNYEPLIVLATAAGATKRIRLMTTVLVAPARNTPLLAKQAASLDALSGGRLTLGLGVGNREVDFIAGGTDFHTRGRRLTAMIEQMKRVWSGQPLSEDTGPIGPAPVRPGGPELLIGGSTPAALKRAGRLADGYIASGSADPHQAGNLYAIVKEAWEEAGRPGSPRFVGTMYTAIGQDVTQRAAEYIYDYYGYKTPPAERIMQSITGSPQDALDRMRVFAEAGADELIVWPAVAELDQVDRIAANLVEQAQK